MARAFAIGLVLAACGLAPLRAQAVDPAAVPMPDLAFTPDAEAIANYDKYFYFHREGTDFAEAYADLRECDGYARGFTFVAGTSAVPYTGLFTTVVGTMVASALSDAIYGAAERRRLRRANMRTCMVYKGYAAFGLPKTLWERFNFEEGNVAVPESRRQELLRIQARAASGPRPRVGALPE